MKSETKYNILAALRMSGLVAIGMLVGNVSGVELGVAAVIAVWMVMPRYDI